MFFPERVGLRNTSITGDLDSIFCNSTLGIYHLEADCGGDDNPEVPCSCCTRCCSDNIPGIGCPIRHDQICHNYAIDWQDNYFGGVAVTTCACSALNSFGFSCTFTEECETCNEDGTICGGTTGLDFFLTPTGSFDHLQTSFRYTKGGPISTEVTWEDFNDGSCKVYVNGRECNSCNALVACEDGFQGVRIDCDNILNEQVDGPTGYGSCFPTFGGVLDIFGWIDDNSYMGCPLVSLRGIK